MKKKEPEKCVICKGTGRVVIRKRVFFPLEYIHIEERCQLCSGKGYIYDK